MLKYAAKMFSKKGCAYLQCHQSHSRRSITLLSPISTMVKTIWNLPKQKLVNVSSGYLGAIK